MKRRSIIKEEIHRYCPKCQEFRTMPERIFSSVRSYLTALMDKEKEENVWYLKSTREIIL